MGKSGILLAAGVQKFCCCFLITMKHVIACGLVHHAPATAFPSQCLWADPVWVGTLIARCPWTALPTEGLCLTSAALSDQSASSSPGSTWSDWSGPSLPLTVFMVLGTPRLLLASCWEVEKAFGVFYLSWIHPGYCTHMEWCFCSDWAALYLARFIFSHLDKIFMQKKRIFLRNSWHKVSIGWGNGSCASWTSDEKCQEEVNG